MADRNVNIVLTATDATQKAVASATSSLSSLAKTAIGTAAGFGLYGGVQAIFGGITNAVFGMNNSLDATGKQAATMLDSIRTSTAQAGTALTATAKQTTDWGRQMREIRERETQGFADFARKTRDLNDELADLLSGKDLQKRARDENEALADLAQDHADRIEQLQQDLSDAQNEGLIVDGVLYRQANDKKVKAAQDAIDKEDAEYQKKLDRRKREYDEDVAELRESNDKRIAEVRRALEEEKQDQLKFTRDIKEAYADLADAKRLALSGGGGAGGLAEGSQAVITYREELQKLGQTGAQIFSKFQKFFKEEGVRSPFNVTDIQQAGAQLAQYSGGNLANMEKIVRMAEALASSPAVQQFSASERLNLGIRALSEAYNGQFTSLQRIFNIAGPTFDSLQKGTFTTSEFTDKLNSSLEATGVNYALVDANSKTLAGAWDNMTETLSNLVATITLPVYEAFRDKLIDINTWVTNNQEAITAMADSLKNRLAKFIQDEVLPRVYELQRALGDYFSSDQWQTDLASLVSGFQAMSTAAMTVANAINAITKNWDGLVNATTNGREAVTGGMLTAMLGPVGSVVNIGKMLKLPGFAAGTDFAPGGIAMVGERGPELVNLPRGSQVIPTDEASRMRNGGPTVHIENFHNYQPSDLAAFARELAWRIS